MEKELGNGGRSRMLNHKFYFDGSDESDATRYIRISDTLIEKMRPDLCRYRFLCGMELNSLNMALVKA